jgi:hypothetical protein
MAGITLTQAQTQLSAYLAAEAAVLTGQRYEIAGRMLMRANLAEIQAGVTTWNNRVATLLRAQNGRSRGRTVVAG